MQITWEEFEHEILKLKQQVPATYRGHKGPGSDFDTQCIIQRIMFNMGAAAPEIDGCRIRAVDVKTAIAIKTAISRNDEGATWHSIIDGLFSKPETETVTQSRA